MTLLVAGLSGQSAWMVADSVVTGGTLGVRERQHTIKIAPSTDDRALIGFAGDEHHGVRILQLARTRPANSDTVSKLLELHTETGQRAEYPSVDLVYAYRDSDGPRLVRISDRSATELPTCHIGSDPAFERFQRIRHRECIDPVPSSFATLFSGSRSKEPAPDDLLSAMTAMLRLSSDWPERDVGGFALPYFLTREGAFLRGYGYSVSDPTIPLMKSGTIIPHGTAEAGGFALSLTEWGNHEGLVAYWLQRPGGILFQRSIDGYSRIEIEGDPKEFLRAAEAALGHPIHIMFGGDDQSNLLSLPDRVTVIRDERGQPAVAVAMHGRNMSVSALNVETEFRAGGLTEPEVFQSEQAGQMMKAKIDDDGKTVTVELTDSQGNSADHLMIDAEHLEAFLKVLGKARGEMKPEVSMEPISPTATVMENMVVDPRWQTTIPPHPSLQGIILRLRHPQLGWVSFLLPHHEAKALGDWLVGNART